MTEKIIRFRSPSAAGPFSCADGEIESAVNARLVSITTANVVNAGSGYPEDGGETDNNPDFSGATASLERLNALTSSRLPGVEFSLRYVPLEGWQNHTDNPPSVTVEAPKVKDAEGWKGRAEEALERFLDASSRRNLFVEPFFALYALRLHDGSHICPSSPVLLLPNKQAPAVEGADDFTLDSMGMIIRAKCARLRCRISAPEGLGDMSDVIEALDIFISAPVPLYHRQNGLSGYHRAPGSQLPQSWIPDSLSDEEFTARLLAVSEFRPVSAILLKDFISSGQAAEPKDATEESFNDVDFNIPDLSGFTTIAAVKEMMSYTPDYMQLHGIEATAGSVISGRTVLWGLTLTLPMPPLPSALVASKSAEEGAADVSVSAGAIAIQTESVKNGLPLYSYRYAANLPDTVIAEADFPKWLFLPDPDARQVTFITSEATFVVPLHRHPLLGGAYYWAGSLADRDTGTGGVRKLPVTIGVAPEETLRRDSYALPDAVWVSQRENPLCLPSRLLMRLDVGEVIAVCRAFRASGLVATTAPTAYLFTDQGIYLVKMQDDGMLRDAGLIARYLLDSPESITLTGKTLEFTDINGDRLGISGTTVKSVAGASGNGTSSVVSGSEEVWIGPYDASLPVTITTRPLKLASLFPNKFGNAALSGACGGSGEMGGVDVIYGLCGSLSCLRKTLWKVQLIGAFSGELQLALYGSSDLVDWLCLASGSGSSVIAYAPPGLRYARLVISGSFSGSIEAVAIILP